MSAVHPLDAQDAAGSPTRRSATQAATLARFWIVRCGKRSYGWRQVMAIPSHQGAPPHDRQASPRPRHRRSQHPASRRQKATPSKPTAPPKRLAIWARRPPYSFRLRLDELSGLLPKRGPLFVEDPPRGGPGDEAGHASGFLPARARTSAMKDSMRRSIIPPPYRLSA
jgi:hypothetical protein